MLFESDNVDNVGISDIGGRLIVGLPAFDIAEIGGLVPNGNVI